MKIKVKNISQYRKEKKLHISEMRINAFLLIISGLEIIHSPVY